MKAPHIRSMVRGAVSSMVSSMVGVKDGGFPFGNRVALWRSREIVNHSSGAGYTIPNAWATTASDANILKNGAHIATSGMPGAFQNWFGNNATLTAGRTGPTGKTSATRVVSTAINGEALSSGITLPAGTYTIACRMRANGSNQTVRMGNSSGSQYTSKSVVTSGWTDFASAFTLGAPGGGITPAKDNGGNNLDVDIDEIRIYVGDVTGAIPTPLELGGHIKLGPNDGSTRPTVNSGYLSLASNQYGIAQLPDAIDLSTGAATYMHVVRIASDPAGVGSFHSLRENVTRHMFGFRGAGRLAHGDGFSQTESRNGIRLDGQGWQVISVVVDPAATQRRYYIGKQLVWVTESLGANTSSGDRDIALWVTQAGSGLVGDWMMGAVWNRALSLTELRQAVDACSAEIIAHGQTAGTKHHVIIAEGDSITNDDPGDADFYPSKAAMSLATRRLIVNLATTGDKFTEVNARRSIRQLIINSDPTRKKLFSVWWTNDVELSGGGNQYINDLETIVDNAVTDGFDYIVACTLTPKTTANYNTERNIANPQIVSVAGVDAVCDFAGNAAYGEDADASNPSLYPDGGHPSDSVQALMRDDWVAVVDGWAP